MKRIRPIITVALILVMLSSFTSLATAGRSSSGLRHDGTQEWLWFDEQGLLVKNKWIWVEGLGTWCHADSEGVLKSEGWFQDIDGSWYYFDEWALMLSNTTTPDGYYVNSSGVWENPTTSTTAQ